MQGLNPAIAAYIDHSNTRDLEAVTSLFKTDAVVEDEGLTHRGIQEIRRWVQKTHSAYRFNLKALDSAEVGAETIVTCLVAGNFPGSPVHLRFFFTLEGEKIAALAIRE